MTIDLVPLLPTLMNNGLIVHFKVNLSYDNLKSMEGTRVDNLDLLYKTSTKVSRIIPSKEVKKARMGQMKFLLL